MDQIELQVEDDSFINLGCTVSQRRPEDIQLNCTMTPDSLKSIHIDKNKENNLMLDSMQLIVNESTLSPQGNDKISDESLMLLKCTLPEAYKEMEQQDNSFHNSMELNDIKETIESHMVLTGELADPNFYNSPKPKIITHYTSSIESIYENKNKENATVVPVVPVVPIAPVPPSFHKSSACDPQSILSPPSQLIQTPPRVVHSYELLSTPSLPSMDLNSKIMIPNQQTQPNIVDAGVQPSVSHVSIVNSSLYPLNNSSNSSPCPSIHEDDNSSIGASIIEDYHHVRIPAPFIIDYNCLDRNSNPILFHSFQFVLLDESKSYESLIKQRGGLITDILHLSKELQTVLIATQPNDSFPFLLAIARNIPKVASFWIEDCIEQNSLLPFHGYELANGYIHGCPIIAPYKSNLFDQMGFSVQKGEEELAEIITVCGGCIELKGIPIRPKLLALCLIQQINLYLL